MRTLLTSLIRLNSSSSRIHSLSSSGSSSTVSSCQISFSCSHSWGTCSIKRTLARDSLTPSTGSCGLPWLGWLSTQSERGSSTSSSSSSFFSWSETYSLSSIGTTRGSSSKMAPWHCFWSFKSSEYQSSRLDLISSTSTSTQPPYPSVPLSYQLLGPTGWSTTKMVT